MDDFSRNLLFRFTSLLVLFFGCNTSVFGQELIFKNIGHRLGLPSYECYDVIQDHKGYVWISTDNGLCRYNGNTSTVFNTKNGLPDNGIYFLKTAFNGNLRLISSGSSVLKWSDNGFSSEKYTAELKTKISRDAQRAYFLTETPTGDIVNTYERTYLADRKSGKLKVLSEPKSPHCFTVVYNRNHSYFIKNQYTIYPKLVDGKYILKFLLNSGSQKKECVISFNEKVEIDQRTKLTQIGDMVFMSIDNKMLVFDSNLYHKIYEFPSKILSLYADPQNGLWVGLFQKGVYHYENIKNMESSQRSLHTYSVTGILVDRENGIWCSTLEKNIFYSNGTHAIGYSDNPKLGKLATLLKTINGKTYVSTAHDNLFDITNSRVIELKPDQKENHDYTDIAFFKNDWYLSNKIVTQITNEKLIGRKVIAKNMNFTAYAFDDFNGKLFASNYTDLFEVRKDSAIRLSYLNARRIRTLAAVSDNVIYIGDNLGLGKVDFASGKRQNSKGITTPVNKILKSKTGNLYIATKGDGLQILENEKLRRITFPEKHDIFYDLAEDDKGTIWASSENGLVSITAKSGKEITRKYGVENGLISDIMTRLAINGNMLFVSTIEGLCAVDINRIVNEQPPLLHLKSIIVNSKPLKNIQKIVLPYDQNSVSLLFDALTFKNNGNDILHYRFIGRDSLWTASRECELRFDNLPPDTYNLAVYAVNNDGVRSKNQITIKFTIQKPFWKQYWFIGIGLLLVGLIFYLAITKIVAYVRSKEHEKTRINTLIAQSQLSALQAQMNPHFIFNAISSIQNYILKNNEKAAYNYLAKFGNLIRMVLNNSRESTLSLDQELETLRLYVQLEQMRFKDSFNFVLEVDEAVDVYNTYLPTMMIQPYVENAIWHGLMNLEDKRQGLVSVKFLPDGELLKIVIEDNGVGREYANSFKKDELHRSIGMQLTEQRLQTIYKLNEYEGIRIDIFDLRDHLGQPIGTRVILIIPINI